MQDRSTYNLQQTFTTYWGLNLQNNNEEMEQIKNKRQIGA